MKKISKSKKASSATAENSPDIASILGIMQQQLTFLEKKIDTLISKSQGRPFERERSSQPSQRPGPSFHHDKPGQDNRFRERQFHKAICTDCNKECQVPFRPTGDRPVYCKECFAKRKNDNSFQEKHDSQPRKEDFAHERHFDKEHRGAHRRSAERKKPIFHRRKK